MMKHLKHTILVSMFFSLIFISCENSKKETQSTQTATTEIDPLPSWNEVTSKNNIIAYVSDVTNPES